MITVITAVTKFWRHRSQNLRIWEFSVARWDVLSSCEVDFLKVLYFLFLVCYAILKALALFIPVWREIHRSKIPPVTSWQLTSRTVSDISRLSRHSICQSFFPAWIYNMIQNPFRRNKSTSLGRRATSCIEAHFLELMRGRLVASPVVCSHGFFCPWCYVQVCKLAAI